MNPYFDFLRAVRTRPEAFVGSAPTLMDTLKRIETALQGFALREEFDSRLIPSDWLRQFGDFVCTREGSLDKHARIELGVASPLALLQRKYVVPMTVWVEFFRLVDEFETQWYEEA